MIALGGVQDGQALGGVRNFEKHGRVGDGRRAGAGCGGCFLPQARGLRIAIGVAQPAARPQLHKWLVEDFRVGMMLDQPENLFAPDGAGFFRRNPSLERNGPQERLPVGQGVGMVRDALLEAVDLGRILGGYRRRYQNKGYDSSHVAASHLSSNPNVNPRGLSQ